MFCQKIAHRKIKCQMYWNPNIHKWFQNSCSINVLSIFELKLIFHQRLSKYALNMYWKLKCDNLNHPHWPQFINLDHITVNFCYLHSHRVHLQFALEICMQPPHILVKLCIFKFSYFDRSTSPPPPASVDRLKALLTVAPRRRWIGSADTGVITPRTPPSPRLNVPSPGFRNCPQNYHPGTRRKKRFTSSPPPHLIFGRLVPPVRYIWFSIMSHNAAFSWLGILITPRTPPLPDLSIPPHPPQNIARKYSPFLNQRRPQLSTLVHTSKSTSCIYSKEGCPTKEDKKYDLSPGSSLPSVPRLFFSFIKTNMLANWIILSIQYFRFFERKNQHFLVRVLTHASVRWLWKNPPWTLLLLLTQCPTSQLARNMCWNTSDSDCPAIRVVGQIVGTIIIQISNTNWTLF